MVSGAWTFAARLLLILAVWSVLLLPSAAQTTPGAVGALQNSLQTSIAKLERSLVAIVVVGPAGPMIVGTGFLVANDGTFVTSMHGLRQAPGVEMRVLVRTSEREPKIVNMERLLSDSKRDLALCRAAVPEGASASSVSPVALAASSDVLPGTLVVISGFPLATTNSSSHFGIVSSHSASEEPLELSVFTNEGESGAPIVRLEDGQVIGMVSSVRIAPTYSGAGRGIEDQNAGLTLGARSEWISALVTRAKRAAEAHQH